MELEERASRGHDGTYLSYTLLPNLFGIDRFAYTVTNALGCGE